jgi:hypothetical protein
LRKRLALARLCLLALNKSNMTRQRTGFQGGG